MVDMCMCTNPGGAGRNDQGQLGLGDTNKRDKPTKVPLKAK